MVYLSPKTQRFVADRMRAEIVVGDVIMLLRSRRLRPLWSSCLEAASALLSRTNNQIDNKENHMTTSSACRHPGPRIFSQRPARPRIRRSFCFMAFVVVAHVPGTDPASCASRFHVVAPDYLGFGYSDASRGDRLRYNFDNITAQIEELLFTTLGLKKFSIYVQDYGAPVGFRIASRHPEAIKGIVVQNGNAYVEGISAASSAAEAFLGES